jgi:hypothetical protein
MEMKQTQRFNLTLPAPVVSEMEKIAEAYDISIVDVIRSFIRIGLLVSRAQNDPDKAVLIREGERITEIFMTPPF